MCTENIYEELHNVEWVQIPGAMYIAKYKFLENEYKIIVTNLTEIFGECLKETEIQTRFLNNNPYAEMKTKVIIKNVKEALKGTITDESTIKVNSLDKSLNIQLKFFVDQVSFIFNLEPAVLSCEKLRTLIIIPTLSYAMIIQKENFALQKKIKDLENKIDSSSCRNLQSNLKLNDFANDHYVTETNMLEVFIEMQNNSKKYFQEKVKSITKSQKKHAPQISSSSQEQTINSVLPVKREIAEVSKCEPEIKYDENIIDNLKMEDNSQTTSVQVSDIKTKKKKKCLKF